MPDSVVIERRFRGPPESANGGYSCGLVAAALEPDPAIEVTLRAPPPLERTLTLETGDGKATLRDGDLLIAEGSAVEEPQLEIPPAVSIPEAEAARRDSPLYEQHAFPSCFVCGPEREIPDGMRVICGPVPGREAELVAAPWETAGWMAGADGAIRRELVWSALDCPSGLAPLVIPDRPAMSVLGRLTAMLPGSIEAGPTYVAAGWPIARDDRKLHTGSAILTTAGEPLAWARAIWIVPREPFS